MKQRLPGLFGWVEAVARAVTGVRDGGRIKGAQKQAVIEGSVNGAPASVWPLNPSDAEALHAFLKNLPPGWLQYFEPHPFDRAGLEKVLRSQAFMNYGLFVDSRMVDGDH